MLKDIHGFNGFRERQTFNLVCTEEKIASTYYMKCRYRRHLKAGDTTASDRHLNCST